MTEYEVFQLLGLVFAGAGLGMLVSPGFYGRMVETVVQTPTMIYMSGIVRLVVGYLLVRYFSYWGWDWRLVLTIFGWFALVIGVLILIVPDVFVRVGQGMWRGGKVRAYGVAGLAAGIVFLVVGFWR